jgi:hypothetical protein
MINDCPVSWYRFSTGPGYQEKAAMIQVGYKLTPGSFIGMVRTGSFGGVSEKGDQGEKKRFLSVAYDSCTDVNPGTRMQGSHRRPCFLL